MADERILARCTAGRNGNLVLSPSGDGFWSDCPCVETDPSVSAYQIFDDFIDSSIGLVTSRWYKAVDTGSVALASAAALALGGIMKFDTTVAQDKWGCLRVVDADAAQGAFRIVANSGKKLWFAARIYSSSAALTGQIIYAGLGDGTTDQCGANGTGASAFTNGLYLRTLTASPTKLDFACINAAVAESAKSAIQTIATTTWYTIGFKFDGVGAVRAYVNGLAVGNPILVSNTAFPTLVGLTPYLYLQKGDAAAASKTVYVDWVKCVQLR